MSQRNGIIFTLALVVLVGGFAYLMVRQMRSSLGQASPESALENLPDPTANDAVAATSATPSAPGAASQPAAASPSSQTPAATPTPPSTATPAPPSSPADPASNQTNSSADNKSASTPDTSSWQDWKNAQFDAEIKYPPGYSVTEDARDVLFAKGNVSWKIRFYTNKDKSAFETWYTGYFPAKDNNACNFAAGELKVGTLATDKVTLNSSAATTNGSSPKCEAAGDYAMSADQSRVVRVYTDKVASDMTTVDQILGTFQFDSGASET